MRVAICDDEQTVINQISACVSKIASKYNIKVDFYTCNNGYELIEFCKHNAPDAIFLDIAMPGIDGFETAERLLDIKNGITLVFVSNNESMVYSSYEYRPFWFVPKSQMSLLEVVVDKIMNKINNIRLGSKEFVVNLGKSKITVSPLEVVYFKNDDHYVQYFNNDGTISQSYRGSISDIESQLRTHFFIRCHSRYIVNCRFIKSLKSKECTLTNGKVIAVSRSRMNEAIEDFHEYVRRMS